MMTTMMQKSQRIIIIIIKNEKIRVTLYSNRPLLVRVNIFKRDAMQSAV